MCVCVWECIPRTNMNDWACAMIVNFVVRTNLGLGFNICVSLGMCMGPRMKEKECFNVRVGVSSGL